MGILKHLWFCITLVGKSIVFHNKLYLESSCLYLKYGWCTKKRQITFRTSKKNHRYLIPDVQSFLAMYTSIFAKECYNFSKNKEKKFTILDFGANIGMSLLYFYENYPNANIIGFEADPSIYKILEKNISSFYTNDKRLTIYNKAVWTEESELYFKPDGNDGGKVSGDGSVKVKTADVRKIMSQYEHIDFLKIDIEGSERAIFPAIKNDLHKVDKLFVEYHSETDKSQFFRELIDILHDSDFRLYIHEVHCGNQPYIEKDVVGGFDMMCEIFAVKESLL